LRRFFSVALSTPSQTSGVARPWRVCIQSASLAVSLIGQGLALANSLLTKHAVRQVDRLLSNRGIDADALLAHWVPHLVGQRDSINVALERFQADWK
jgi:hypothetical protein